MIEVQNVDVDVDVLNPRNEQAKSVPDVSKEETKPVTVVNERQSA